MRRNDKFLVNICRAVCLLFGLAILLSVFVFFLRGTATDVQVSSSQPAMEIVLIPLDSRPPCRDFPGKLAQLVNINVLLPPPGYLDYYQYPSDSQALTRWLTLVAPMADAVIISIDQLVHGGLLASRIPAGNRDRAAKALVLLEEIHRQNPHIPIYVFSIIPRLLLADTVENVSYREEMAEYSILADKLSLAGNTEERRQLEQLEGIIPPDIRQRYQDMYETNLWVGQQLMSMAAKGILHHVIIGQDDASRYGIPNMTKRALQSWADEHSNTGRITITRGTDEIAATLVGRLVAEQGRLNPRICIRYSWSGAAQVVMPYMPNTVAQTVAEKISLIKGIQVESPAEADFILYIHIGTPATSPGMIKHAADEIKGYIKAGYIVSLVDLSETYDRRKNLFPYLEKSKIELSKLASYNGWNTTSNSVGTAVAHAVLYIYGRQNSVLMEKRHYAYLFQHILDDWYYQKIVQPELNSLLRVRGIIPGCLGEHYKAADYIAQKEMAYHASNVYTRYFKHNFCGKDKIEAFYYQSSLPWPRTFEIRIDAVFN